jgi:hypothetical protein
MPLNWSVRPRIVRPSIERPQVIGLYLPAVSADIAAAIRNARGRGTRLRSPAAKRVCDLGGPARI